MSGNQTARARVTVAIPTFGRDRVLLDTLESLLSLRSPPSEILVLDQTQHHAPETNACLERMEKRGGIHWVRLVQPSITIAMNRGLLLANEEIVLFLDDDIRPEEGLVEAHAEAHSMHADILVAGRVIQPWEEGRDISSEPGFQFASTRSAWMTEFMGGNFSVRRSTALSLGGFDENFVRVAFRFEAEFAYRFLASGRRIHFEPAACIHHLKEPTGGTRTFGGHLTTSRPDHSVGAYYYFLRTGAIGGFIKRPLRAVATRYHLRHPWWIPSALLAELRGMRWAWRLNRQGPRYVRTRVEG